ncbi:hypothetical protein [Paraglaciecola hydrolytica]|uniref:Histidine kinase n=1 Tax=Paraglaciecola hydrolytica TaxID=1799789 RepID=A0A136A5D3_9ALTE|nr:hypothetical protein [Paraglaciecola hydrolytica]KXI30455.1 hypothetical protein AX660_10855 [Paraglaciecola hydrolytica]
MVDEFEYSIGLALFDFIPVLLSSVGLILVALSIGLINPQVKKFALFSAILIIIGGFCKVFWKFLIASTDVHYPVLNNSFFIFMAPGFTLLTYYLWSARQVYRHRVVSQYAIFLPLLVIALCAGAAGYLAVQFPQKRLWFIALLTLVTLANIVFIWHAVRHCWQQKLKPSALLFILNLVGVFALAGLARAGHQDEATQWIEQILNAFTQGALLVAAYLLYKKHKKID